MTGYLRRQPIELDSGQPRLTLHDLRHTYGSHLVRQGGDVVTVSRQMGHARPSITLDVYSHEFAATSSERRGKAH